MTHYPPSVSTPQAGNSASTGPIMNFAPAHVLPTAPAVRCAPGRCDICDGQFLTVTYQANSSTARRPHPCLTGVLVAPRTAPTTPASMSRRIPWRPAVNFLWSTPAARRASIHQPPLRAQTEGVRNGRHEAAPTYAEAKALWALSCLRWHGHECRRERLQRLDARGVHWAVKGFDQICGSRTSEFVAARDVAELVNWLEADDKN
ncbi:hypothetical protein B0H14DRAFT_3508721 [Mycena olivaceomarginata]|nr:hypothetical protein B0H14DRAFT_3508721 [Mycena olivaceomarginata]